MNHSKDGSQPQSLWFQRRAGRPGGRPVHPPGIRRGLGIITVASVAIIFSQVAWAQVQPPQDPPTEQKTDPKPPEVVLLEGQIIDGIGGGVADVVITVRKKTDDGSEGEVIATGTTARYGDFTIRAAKAYDGDVVVTCTKKLFEPLVQEFTLDPEEDPPFLGEELTGNLKLSGKVIDAMTDKPVRDAAVTLESMYREWQAQTDDKGVFEIEGLSAGQAVVRVEAEGYGREKLRLGNIDGAKDVTVSLKPERIVRIEVNDERDRPISGVTVECFDEPRNDFRTFVTDDSGRATMKGIHFDAVTLSLRLTHEDHVSSQDFDREITTPADENESKHKLVMQRAGIITGKIIDAETRQPVNGARVVNCEVYTDFAPMDWTTDTGEFTIRGVKPGPNVITVHLSGYAPELYEVEVVAAQSAKKNIRLKKPASLRGVVRTEEGEPVAGIEVVTNKWRGYATLSLRAMTNESGEFVIENIPHDEFEILVGMGRSPTTLMVKADDEQPIEIEIPASAMPGASANAATIPVGDDAPDFEVTTVDGDVMKLSELSGKTVLLDYWATWCGPCIAELPHVKEVFRKYGDRDDFVMISLSLDYDEDALLDFIKREEMNWFHVYGDEGGAQKAADAYGVGGIPSLFVIGPDGKVVAKDLRGEQIVTRIGEILKENKK